MNRRKEKTDTPCLDISNRTIPCLGISNGKIPAWAGECWKSAGSVQKLLIFPYCGNIIEMSDRAEFE